MLLGAPLAPWLLLLPVRAGDQPQWGQAWSRNMVSAERGLPDSFDLTSGRHVRWRAPLGTESHSTPIVANGRVYIGTNNGEPRDPRHQGDRGVMLCLDERDGHLLWQLVVPKREEDPFHDWPRTGMSSPVTVEGDRVYLVNNRGEVMCLDAKGLADGNDGPFREEGRHMSPRGTNAPAEPMQPGPLDADVLWMTDLTREAGIWSHDGAHSSILIRGDHLYLNSGTGVDNTHKKIRTPDAPSLLVLDKKTGRILARDDEHIAPDIFHCTWSSPSLGQVDTLPVIFLAAGNGVVHAFPLLAASPRSAGEVERMKSVWRFDLDPAAPKTEVHRYNTNRREGPSNIYGMPLYDEAGRRVFVAGGGDLFWGKNEAWLKCIRATGRGDVTPRALAWSYPLEKHVLSTPVLHQGMIFIADCGRKVHCVDAATGQGIWTHDIRGEVWATPLIADGKMYLGTRAGEFLIFAASREKQLLFSADVGAPISATATAANRVLYVATMKEIVALDARK